MTDYEQIKIDGIEQVIHDDVVKRDNDRIEKQNASVKIKYWDIQRLLHMKDANGCRPRIFMAFTNRTAGKTTGSLKYLLERFRKTGEHFCIIYRYKYEVTSTPALFADVLELYPHLGAEMEGRNHAQGMIQELTIDGKTCGFATALVSADGIRKFSPLFARVQTLLMDEVQTESGKYLEGEVEKFQSLITTIGRGGGTQSRELDVILLGNMVSIMNPWYIHFGIYKRLRANTRKLSGDGWVAEFSLNDSASKAIETNTTLRAFGESRYRQFSMSMKYLYDDKCFLNRPQGRSRYMYTIIIDGERFGVRDYYDSGYVYISEKDDPTYNNFLTFKVSDHNDATMFVNKRDTRYKGFKELFEIGYMRFDTVKTKGAVFDALAINMYR